MSSNPTTIAAAPAVDESGMTPVHYAVLLGFDKDGLSRRDHTPSADLLEALERALASGHDVNHKDSRGKTALHYSCSRKDENGIIAAERLLKCPTIDLEVIDKEGKTALHYAAEQQEGCGRSIYSQWNTALIQMLLEAGANANVAVESTGRTALHYACAGRFSSWTGGALSAKLTGTKTAVQFLLKGGADMRLVDKTGRIPLHEVTSPETAKVLLDHNGTNNKDLLDWPNKNGDTPLHRTLFDNDYGIYNNEHPVICWYGMDIPLAKCFVEAGADIFKPNQHGWRPIDSIPAVVKMEVEGGETGVVSTKLNEQIEFLTTLVPIMKEKVEQRETDCDVDLSWSSIGGKMLLKVMQEFDGSDGEDIFEHIDPLVSAGADLTYTDPETGWNLFHCFVGGNTWRDVCAETWEDEETYDLDVMQRVLARHPEDQRKALIGAKTTDGCTLLHFAAHKGQAKIAAWLLEQSLDVSARDTNGWTPLHWACTTELRNYGYEPMMELLVQNGGLVTARTWKDRSGNRVSQTPWEIATAKSVWKGVLDFLEHSPLVHQQLKEQCQRALGREWSSSLNGRLLECILHAGPAGFAVAYKFLPGLVAPPATEDERTG